MALGVEYGAKYTLTGPDGTIVVFNDSTDPNFVGSLSPESSGLDSPDVREDAQDRTEDDGGIHGNFYYGRRPVVLQGTISATSATQRNERVEKLMRATNALRGDATLKWKPAGATEEVELKLRRQQPLRITKGFVKDFQAAMVSAAAGIKGVTEQKKTIEVANTGIKAAGAGANTTGVGTKAWTNPVNILTSNDVRASVELSGAISNWLRSSSHGIVLPSGAIPRGIEVSIEKKRSAAGESTITEAVKLAVGGVVSGSTRGASSIWPSIEATEKVGSSTDLWGLSLTKAQVENSGFGAAINASFAAPPGTNAEVDFMGINVYYVAPATVTNGGNFEAAPVVKIYGPVTNPVLENQTSGKKLELTYALLEGDYIVIDFNAKTILRSTTENLYSKLNFTVSDWWTLAPGNNTILSTAAKTEITHQNAWI